MLELTDEQKLVLDKIESGYEGVLSVIGEAGTGKSFLIAVIDYYCRNTGKSIVKLAPTNTAAKNINGSTIHSFFRIAPETNYDADDINSLVDFVIPNIPMFDESLDVMIIDEVSMLPKDLLDYIRIHNIKLLILFGDKQQLPPVKAERVDMEAYEHIELTKQMRNTSNIYGLIKDFREFKNKGGKLSDFNFDGYLDGEFITKIKYDDYVDLFRKDAKEFPSIVTLGFTNKLIDDCLDKLKPEIKGSQFIVQNRITMFERRKGRKFREVVYATNGDKVTITDVFTDEMEAMSRSFSMKDYYLRWDLDKDLPFDTLKVRFKELYFPYTHVILKGDTQIYYDTINRLWKKVWQIRKWDKERTSPEHKEAIAKVLQVLNDVAILRHAWASTVHKAQGKGFDCVYILDDVKQTDLMYVALSRAREKIVFVEK
jgi:ABC-type dipeptide/oligopeptide/nickel transport system ATPase component